MINLLIAHVVTELNEYLKLRSGVADRVVAGTLMTADGKANSHVNEKVAAVMVNVEEDRVYKSIETVVKKPDGTGQVGRPEIRLKFYLLFAANLAVYSEALKAIGFIVTFFQHRDIFEYAAVPLPGVAGRMVFELHSLTFEQQNHLWGAMGAKYLPSVLYKVGVVTIREDLAEAEVPPVSDLAATGGNR